MKAFSQHARRAAALVLLAAGIVLISDCQTLKEIASLRRLDFALAGATEPTLGGIDLSRIRSPDDLAATEMIRLASALVRDELDFDVTLHVSGENPADNPVDARVVKLDWTLLLDDRETISGITDSDILIPPGTTADIPVIVSVNLAEFFDTGIRDLVDLALAASGVSGKPKRVKLRATPTVDTVIGPIRYPEPITIASVSVGD